MCPHRLRLSVSSKRVLSCMVFPAVRHVDCLNMHNFYDTVVLLSVGLSGGSRNDYGPVLMKVYDCG